MNRLAHHQRDLLGRESTEVIQFHDPGEFRVARGELFKGEIEIEQGGGVAGRGGRVVALAVEGERSAAAALRGGPRAGIVHKHLPHDPRHQSEEVHPVGEARNRRAENLQIGLVDQRCRLQSVDLGLPAQQRPGQPAELVVELRGQIAGPAGARVAQTIENVSALTLHEQRKYSGDARRRVASFNCIAMA